MTEKFLQRIINLLNRAQPDGLTFDTLTFHLYNSEQDIFGECTDMRSIATKLRAILNAYSTHITMDERGAYHLRKGIPQQLSFNFNIPEEVTDSNIIIAEPIVEDYGEQLFIDLFDDVKENLEQTPTLPPYPFPTLFDNDPYFM